VLATTVAVAAVARQVFPGMGWAEAVALGAIVSPPDAIAATAILRRFEIPRRGIAILEGESLVNDATALIVYRAAVGAVVTGTFVWGHALPSFVLAATGGVLVGWAVAAATRWLLSRMADTFTEIAITLLAPYIAWVLAENLHASAVLACVSGGLYLRRHFSATIRPTTRLQARSVWDVLVFMLNGTIFILLGLQLGTLRQSVPAGRFTSLLLAGVAISAIAIVVRLIWVPLAAWLPRAMSPSLRARDPMPPWSLLFIVAWGGMRGIVTLAAALALPAATAAGTPFPFRPEIIVVSFVVILVTLVLQGLSFAPVIRLLHIEPDHGLEREEMHARERAAAAALERLERLAGDGGSEAWLVQDQLERLKDHYGRRLQRFAPSAPVDPECTDQAADAFRRLRDETLEAERRALIGLRNDGTISDEVLHRLEHELDIEALRLGLGIDAHGRQRDYRYQEGSVT
jgi:CPA1 family monovalent cation:H+ antiporter